MKLTTAFKLSALVIAVASTATVQAITVDSLVTVPKKDANDVVIQDAQYVDLGGKVEKSTVAGTSVKTGPVMVSEYLINNKKYYLVNNQVLEANAGKLDLVAQAEQEELKSKMNSTTFQRGGTSNDYEESTERTSETIKLLNQTNLTYGETVTDRKGAGTGEVAVTNSSATSVEKFDIKSSGSGAAEKTVNEVKVGIVGTDSSAKNVYGLTVEKTGSVTTKVEAGTVTTGNVVATGITLGGTDLIATIDAKDATTLASANGYTDTKAIDTLAKADLAAKSYADTKATDTLAKADTAAKAYADGKAADTLTEAKSYTDAAVSSFSSTINSLNKRLDDVEETAYRGTAIALAAAQQVPNIKAGQFALFGGVGHYEGESAVAIGGVFAVSETVSISGALGTAGSEVGGRVGASFVFGAD